MPSEIRAITDPFNNRIYLMEGVCDTGTNNQSEIYDDASMVIRKPSICIEVKQKETTAIYYFRSVGWHETLLITVQFQNNRWETSHCERNPTNETLSMIMKKGRQLL